MSEKNYLFGKNALFDVDIESLIPDVLDEDSYDRGGGVNPIM